MRTSNRTQLQLGPGFSESQVLEYVFFFTRELIIVDRFANKNHAVFGAFCCAGHRQVGGLRDHCT